MTNVHQLIDEGNLHKWFSGSKSKDGKKGWVNVVTGGTCASDKPGEGTPKCVSSSKRASMTKAERLSASRRKKKADPNQQSKTGAAKPTYVSTDKPKKKMKEETQISEADKKGKGSGKKDACYHKVKASASVWPSAYASGRLVQCRKKGAANYGNSKKESYSWRKNLDIDEGLTGARAQRAREMQDSDIKKGGGKRTDADRDTAFRLGTGTGEDRVSQRKRTGASAQGQGNAAKRRMKEEKSFNQFYDECWKTHKKVGMKMKGGKLVPDCRPKNEEVENIDELDSTTLLSYSQKAANQLAFKGDGSKKAQKRATGVKRAAGQLAMKAIKGEETEPHVYWSSEALDQLEKIQEKSAAWQRSAGKNKSGGLNEKGRKSYERENPGSDLKAPSKKVGNPRRASFCARMKGMKKKLTSSKTANDPDSRINKSLRKWNC